MFGQSNFGQLVFAQDHGEGEIFFPTWGVKCPEKTTWIEQNKEETGLSPCSSTE